MCGIAGLISSSSPIADGDRIAAAMAHQLRHRGPDGACYYDDGAALLVHTRLSIIDLQTGQQPIHNEEQTIWVVFNGEIFNYVELRRELEARGHRFYTYSDTEVIVHLYEEHGPDFVAHLNGQFSICLWDAPQQTALLVRDRVGITPLYYTLDRRGLWFGSEVKAILAGRGETPQLNSTAVDQLLTFWTPVGPHSVFKDIDEVAPGQMLIFRQGDVTLQRYWDFTFPAAGNCHHDSETDIAEYIKELLFDAVKIRLRSDVPVGAYLSGGLDSSILAAIINHQRDARLRTFSVNFDDPELDEGAYQQQLVDQLRVDHASCSVQQAEMLRDLPRGVWHTETPMIRTAPLPMGRLSALAHDSGFKVVLTGEGADEVFGGYDLFKENKLRQFWARQPNSAWRPLLLKRLYPYLELGRGNAAAYLERFFGTGVGQPDAPLFSHLPRMNTVNGVKAFLEPAFARAGQNDAAETLVASLPDEFDTWSSLAKAQYLEAKTLMAGYLLSSQGDRMLMQHSVEGRFPYLDHRLIDYVNRLSPTLKIKALQEKYILKKALGFLVPDAIVKRYKLPYRAPMGAAFGAVERDDGLSFLLSDVKLRDYGYFDHKKVGFLLKKARAGRTSYKDDMALTFILSCQAWHHLFVEEFQRHFVGQCAPAIPRINRAPADF